MHGVKIEITVQNSIKRSKYKRIKPKHKIIKVCKPTAAPTVSELLSIDKTTSSLQRRLPWVDRGISKHWGLSKDDQ